MIGGYLARIALDERKRIAVVYCTNGDGGGNSVGSGAGAALGQMREIEARRALAAYGISNVWFLAGHDTPGQNVLRSLDSWNHGRALDEVVRLVRITQPDVILTWLPDAVVGENHGDHQASSVLAVEAFEGTDDMLKRAGSFNTDAALFVKTVKARQDYRFDVPCFGRRTLETMKEAQIRSAALEVGRVILLDKPAVLEQARDWNLHLFGFS